MRSPWLVASTLAGACLFGACGDDSSSTTPPPPPTDAGADTTAPPSTLCPGGVAVDWPPGPYGMAVGETLDNQPLTLAACLTPDQLQQFTAVPAAASS